jgi:hypothetical protein
MDSSLAGTVTFDGKKVGKVMAGEFQALLVDREIIPLPHPLEWARLRAHNQSYLSASVRGMLLRVERRICLHCGNVFDAPRLVFSPVPGCFVLLVAVLASFTLFRLAFDKSTSESVFMTFVVLIAVLLIIQVAGILYIRMRFSERQESIAQRQCQGCGSSDSVSVSKAVGKRLQIGSEGMWVQVSIAGKS